MHVGTTMDVEQTMLAAEQHGVAWMRWLGAALHRIVQLVAAVVVPKSRIIYFLRAKIAEETSSIFYEVAIVCSQTLIIDDVPSCRGKEILSFLDLFGAALAPQRAIPSPPPHCLQPLVLAVASSHLSTCF